MKNMSATTKSRPTTKKVDVASLKKTYANMFKSLKGYWGWIILAIVLSICSVVVQIIAPQIMKLLTDAISDGAGRNAIDMALIGRYGIILVIFYSVVAVTNYLSGYIMASISQRYAERLRKDLCIKINKMPLSYFDGHQYGDTLSIMTNDIDQIGQSLQQGIGMLISSVVMLIGVLIAMFITSWQMALTVMSSLPLMILFLLLILKLANPQFKARQRLLGEVNGVVEENFSGQLIIKAFNSENSKSQVFNDKNKVLGVTMVKAQFFGGLMMPIMSFISYFAFASVCVVGGLLMNAGNLVTFGTISAFLIYVNLFQSPLAQIAQAVDSLQMAAASGKRVFDFMEEKEVSSEDNKVDLLQAVEGKKKIRGEVEFSHVKFSYDESRVIIPDFSAKVKPGMKVAIVGPTGAGKTTLVNLLMRFYEVDSGDILIDGISTKDMSRSELRDIFGMVLQDTWIFEGSLRDNIVYSTKNVSEEKLNKAISEASLSHYISTLPGGLDYVIENESALSGGEKQLLTIARAMVEDAPLLILDEATSNVDTRTEEVIQVAMDRLSQGRTSFVIAHRLSTIKNADLILVMRDGNIVEQGNHEKLMELGGFYASLYNSQFAGE